MKFCDLEKYCIENNISFSLNEPMSLHTSFKIGGPADFFITVEDEKSLAELLKIIEINNIPLMVIGKGSNLLVSDKGIAGVVINITGLKSIELDGSNIIASAGAALSEVCRFAEENSLTGLEFAYGIPGSVGGGLYMNAGAYGGEMKDVVVSANYITTTGDFGSISAKDMKLGYRTSIFKDNNFIITSVKFALKTGNKDDITALMEDIISRRKAKQPLEYPSAGSTFKRPEGYFAGTLIEKNGLKGCTIGGASVSEKHAGFLINSNGASCEDVLNLIKKVQNVVYMADGVKLEPEVIFVGKN